jgi:hypothetical protein
MSQDNNYKLAYITWLYLGGRNHTTSIRLDKLRSRKGLENH